MDFTDGHGSGAGEQEATEKTGKQGVGRIRHRFHGSTRILWPQKNAKDAKNLDHGWTRIRQRVNTSQRSKQSAERLETGGPGWELATRIFQTRNAESWPLENAKILNR